MRQDILAARPADAEHRPIGIGARPGWLRNPGIPDSDDPHGIVARLAGAVPPGSYLAVSHMGSDLLDRETADGLEDITERMIQQDFTFRSRAQVARFFEGMDLVDPGLVRVEEWHPEPETGDMGTSSLWCAAGRRH